MTEILRGDRIGRLGEIRSSVAAYIQDSAGKVLLTQRADNGRWCLPGGHVDPGESVTEACAREVFEETGLVVQIGRLIGVYSSPDYLVAYPDGNRVQFVSVCLEALVLSGVAEARAETTAVGFFTLEEIRRLDVIETHRQRIEDGAVKKEAAFVR